MDAAPFQKATLADLPAFGAAHRTNAEAGTGCTVVVAPEGAVCGVDVRGGGPATRETDLLRPENMVQKVHAVALSGGSAFGLAASTGVMDVLAEQRIGFELGGAFVPIVTQACLFDLLVGENAFPGHDEGAEAARAALKAHAEGAADLAQGNAGAGTGATVGKLLGPQAAMKSGFGWAGVRAGDLVAVALVAVNACGNVRDRDGRWIAGCRDAAGSVMDPLQAMALAAAAQAGSAPEAAPCTNTTIGAVLTNAKLTKAEATKAASMAHDAYARAIKPVHTMNDGDTIFVMASGEAQASVDAVGMLACEAMQDAIISAVLSATPAYGLPAAVG